MATDKKISYMVQGGVKNYKPSKMVTAPKTAKSSPKHPTAHLAYITKKEQDFLVKKNLHGSLKGKPNKGPSGIVSLQGDFGPGGTGGSYGGHEGADVSGTSDRGTGDYGVTDRAVQNAYNKNRSIREANERAVDKMRGLDTRYSGGINTTGFNWGNLGRGIMSVVGGIPGKIGSFLSTMGGKFKGQDLANANQAIQNDPNYESDMDTGYARTHLSSLANKMAPIESVASVSSHPKAPNVVYKDGGRIGYRDGLGVDPVLDVQEDENTLEFMNDQGIPHGDMAGTSPFELRIQELMDTGMSWQEAYQIASEEFGQVVEGESDQGIASIV